jgi:hypothetical protein
MTDIDIACEPRTDGWACRVVVGDPGDRSGSTAHEVTVDAALVGRLAAVPGFDDVDRLLRETFAFLLEREPKEAILRRFDLAVVERYFPEYPREMRRRLGG